MAADVQTAFTEGCMACASGLLRAANPYPGNTAIWGGWQRGWMHEYHRLPVPLRMARQLKEPGLEAADDRGPPIAIPEGA